MTESQAAPQSDSRKPAGLDLFNRAGLDWQASQPAYQQIQQLIRSLIQSGQLKTGDLLPPENDLCRHFAVSRTTIRQALDILVENGLLIRQRGRGSFVSTPKLRRTLDHLYSFTDDMRQLGLQPSSQVLACRRQKADPAVAQALSLPAAAEVFRLERLRLADGQPILQESTAIPYHLCPDIEQIDFSRNSLYGVLQNQYGLRPARATESYEAIAIAPDLARLLDCPEPAIGFQIRRVAWLDNGAPFEFTCSVTRSDRCVFTVELNAARSQVHFSRQISI